jgi:diguanylate cyclase (GGDEF)-like protein
MDQNKSYDNLYQNKTELTYKAIIVTIVILIIANDISLLFSVWSLKRKIFNCIITTGIMGLMLVIIVVLKAKIKDFKLLNFIYFISILVLLTLVIIVSYDRGTVSIMAFLAPLIMLVYINFNKKYANILLVIYLIANTFYLITMPIVNLVTGVGFYIMNYGIIIVSFYMNAKGIDMFRNYEKLLYHEIAHVEENYETVSALNEELMASEEEIRMQYTNISELNKCGNKLIESLNAVFEASDDGIIDIDKTNSEINMSPQAVILLQEKIESFNDFLHKISMHMRKDEIPRFVEVYDNLMAYDKKIYGIETEYMVYEQVKVLRFNFVSYKSAEDGSEHIVSVVKDVTTEFNKTRKIYKMAYEDSLTGLLNRAAFIEKIENERNTDNYNNIHVYIVDFDNFKYINDTFGYTFGDKLLIEAAQCFKQLTHPNIKAVARISGDDFAIMTDSYFEGDKFYNWIQTLLSHFSINEIDVKLYCSIGIASAFSTDESAYIVLKNAEIAMYKAKERGKRGFFEYSSALQNEMRKKIILTNAMEKALDGSEFSLNYQPKYDTGNMRIVGYEALIRWNSSELGWVPPLDFIILAEQTGYIHEIGEFVIREACRFAKEVNEAAQLEIPLIISINVSAVQLLNANFFDLFMQIVEEVGVLNGSIGIEVTETVIMVNKEFASRQLERFREKGIKVYLDDFGTGYSSLNYFTQLPIDIIKIDKTFIDRILLSDREYQVVSMIISLANVFCLKTVAEGVETEEQFKMLQNIGCHIIQGYYFSRPLKEKDAYKLVTK